MRQSGWLGHLRGDPLPWLLAEDTPAVRAEARGRLLDRPSTGVEVQARHSSGKGNMA
jgi:hypothetical protein